MAPSLGMTGQMPETQSRGVLGLEYWSIDFVITRAGGATTGLI